MGIRWGLKNNLDESGAITRNKSRLVHNDETFTLVAKMEAIRLLISSATLIGLKLFQMDVDSAFLNGNLKEEVYIYQPSRF